MVKLQTTPLNEKGNFFDYRILAKARNEHLGKYAPPTNPKLKEINNIFIKNNYIPVDITGKIGSEISTILGIPILNPKVIIFGGFEYHYWGLEDNKVLSCFEELLDKNLIDEVLSYSDELSAVDEIKTIENYCKKNKIVFEYNDIYGLQSNIRDLKKMDSEIGILQSKILDLEERKQHVIDTISYKTGWTDCQDQNIPAGAYYLFKKRAEYCSEKIKKNIKNHNILMQLLSLEEVANAPYIAEELSKREIPFVSYILDDVPH